MSKVLVKNNESFLLSNKRDYKDKRRNKGKFEDSRLRKSQVDWKNQFDRMSSQIGMLVWIMVEIPIKRWVVKGAMVYATIIGRKAILPKIVHIDE